MIKKSILASIFISFGVTVSLTLGNPLGAILFSFGLLCVCGLDANLFTGKAGYLWRTEKLKLFQILIINLVSGWLMGFLISIANPSLVIEAQNKILTWNFDLVFFLKSILCGMIMYIAVEMYRRDKSVLGIIYGIPTFILCGFQHCIANVIVLGVGRTFSITLILCTIGNLLGSIIINILQTESTKQK